METKIVKLNSGATVKAQIWDTAGNEKYKAMTSAHYRKAVGAFVFYDITNLDSFNNIKKWVTELKLLAEPEIVIMMIGNKADLENSRVIKTEDAMNYAKNNGMLFYETSAISGLNIKESFEDLLNGIIKKLREQCIVVNTKENIFESCLNKSSLKRNCNC